jgi:hypothetical protein
VCLLAAAMQWSNHLSLIKALAEIVLGLLIRRQIIFRERFQFAVAMDLR